MALLALSTAAAQSGPDIGPSSGTDPEAVLKVARAAEQAGDWETAEELLSGLASDPTFPGASPVAGECLRELVTCRLHLGDYSGAVQAGDAAADYYNRRGDHAAAAQVYSRLGNLLRAAGRNALAGETLSKALVSFSESGDRVGMAATRVSLGVIAEMQGEYERAMEHYDAALELFRQTGDEESIAQCYRSRGFALTQLDRLNEACSSYQQALYLCNQLGLDDLAAETHCDLGESYLELKDYSAAIDEFEAGLALWSGQEYSPKSPRCLQGLAAALMEVGRNEEAFAALDAAFDKLENAGQAGEIDDLLPSLSEVLMLLDRADELPDYRQRLGALREASGGGAAPAAR